MEKKWLFGIKPVSDLGARKNEEDYLKEQSVQLLEDGQMSE